MEHDWNGTDEHFDLMCDIDDCGQMQDGGVTVCTKAGSEECDECPNYRYLYQIEDEAPDSNIGIDMIEVTARLDIEIFVDCPSCDYLIDLMRPKDTSGVDFNEEGSLLNQACPSNEHWSVAHETFEATEVICSKCDTKFNVKGLEW